MSIWTKHRGLAGIAFLAAATASSGAFSQASPPPPNCTFSQTGPVVNLGFLALPAGAASAAIAGAIGNVNTAFLTQQGSAFVSAPANPLPDQPGGGIWTRALAGEVDLNTTSTSQGTWQVPAAPGANTSTTTHCNNETRQNFAGLQVGTDISRLNWYGWNVHLGATAGNLGEKSTDNNEFYNGFDVPFLGAYLVATKGRFFADIMVREEFYNGSLLNPNFNFYNQPVGAHGYSVSTSAGYNFDVGNNWFIEPSAGFVYSNTSVDNFTFGGPQQLPISGTISTNDVVSEIGRASLRVGKVIETPTVTWQPFASASVFHEFAGNVVSNFQTCNGCAFTNPGGPSTFSQQTSTSRVGTYGQYSLGVAAQLVGTGFLGFARVDYREGSNIQGWTGNAGIRYQFAPDMVATALPTKAVKAPVAVVGPTNWTGFYAGLFGGVAYGRTDIGFVNDTTGAGSRPWTFGALGGGEIGYNRQLNNNWVVGVEGDIGAANVHGGRTAGAATGRDPLTGDMIGFSPFYFTAQDKTDWMATATARAGYAWNRTLFYAKGGLALEDSHVSAACVFGPTGFSNPILGIPPFCVNQAPAITPGFAAPGVIRVGWTLGFGTEFDLGRGWSAKSEYDYLSFGRTTGVASDGTTILTSRSDISQVKVGLNYRLGAPATTAADAFAADLPVKAAPLPSWVSLWQVEVGGRYFFSTGKMRLTLGDPFVAGQINSQVTHANMDSNAGEGFARIDHSSGFFLKGFLGGGNIFNGKLNDEDFPPGIVPYSNTVSDINNGRLWYGTVDLGWNPWQMPNYKVGFFVGYNHFYETANGYSCTQVATNPDVCFPGEVPLGTLVLTETQNWDGVRLGVNGVFALIPRLSLTVDAAVLPYVSMTGIDNHWLRPDINPLPQAGHGWGYQLEGILAYDVTPNFSVGVGGRYWWAETTTGTTQFPQPCPGNICGPIVELPPSPTKFTTERYGGFLQASYKFGEPPVVAKY